jgi:serine/threonine protein kinase
LQITQAFDIWSLGVSILSLLSKTQVYQAKLNEDHIWEAYNGAEESDSLSLSDSEDSEDGEDVKEDKVLTILAREVIAENKKEAYPFIMELCAALEEDFPNLMDIVRECLKTKPEKRPTAKKLMENNIFRGLNFL